MKLDPVFEFVQWAFGTSDDAGPFPEWAETEVHHMPVSRGTLGYGVATVADYRHAVDDRDVSVESHVRSPELSITTFAVSGRHVGTLGSAIPTGRRFSTFVVAVLSQNDSHSPSLQIQCGVLAELTQLGFQWSETAQTFEPCLSIAAQRNDLLDGQPEVTLWAKSWQLPRRLARLAVLLMAGVPIPRLAERLTLSVKSVRTYTEQLFERAGIRSRSELPLAALQAGKRPI